MNHWIILILSSVPLGILIYWGGNRLFYKIAQQKGISFLGKIYFTEGVKQKNEILNKFNEITNHQYTKQELIDYFLKIKGLQNFNKDGCDNFWIRHYLKQKTKIKLNYFEQCNFFKAFKHFPEKQEGQNLMKRKSTMVKTKQIKKTMQITV